MKNSFHSKQNFYFHGIITIIILFFISICIGRYNMSIYEIIESISSYNNPNLTLKIITKLRIPRALTAILIGIALSLSGAIYQGVFNNKLVSPDLLGVSSGASVGACCAILFNSSNIIISFLSFIFGLLTVFLTIMTSKIFKNKNNIILILSGIAINGLMSSFIGLIKYIADDDHKLAEMTYWLLGDISEANMNNVYFLFITITICSIISLLFSNQINAISLGEREAKTNGVNYHLVIYILIICATMMTATSVAIGGTIGWIGLSIPNITRLIFGNDHKKVLPYSMIIGSIFMLIVDTLSRTLAPNEIPLTIISGIIGTPLFILAIFKRRKEIQ